MTEEHPKNIQHTKRAGNNKEPDYLHHVDHSTIPRNSAVVLESLWDLVIHSKMNKKSS